MVHLRLVEVLFIRPAVLNGEAEADLVELFLDERQVAFITGDRLYVSLVT